MLVVISPFPTLMLWCILVLAGIKVDRSGVLSLIIRSYKSEPLDMLIAVCYVGKPYTLTFHKHGSYMREKIIHTHPHSLLIFRKTQGKHTKHTAT